MGTVLASDITGSSLTIAFQNAEQDSASRKFLVSSTSRGDAITTVTTALGSANHPDESFLKANRITAQAVGPSRWLVTVQYIRRRIGGLPSGGAATLANMRASSEAVEVYCSPEEFQNGLPYGGGGETFVNPGPPDGQSTDAANRPRPWVYNRPVLQIAIPFSSSTNPITSSIGQISKVNKDSENLGLTGVSFGPGELRYDGGEVRSVAPSGSISGGATRYYGTINYTFAFGGWYKQILRWNNDAWKAFNVNQYDMVQ